MVVAGYVYRANGGPATIDCIDPKTGQVRWEERAGTYWASIVMAGGLLYAIDRDAVTTVFRPNPEKLEVVAKSGLDGVCNATPAVADGRLFIRTDTAVYCIGD